MQRLPAGDAFDLFERLLQSVTVKGTVVRRIDRQEPVLNRACDHGHFPCRRHRGNLTLLNLGANRAVQPKVTPSELYLVPWLGIVPMAVLPLL